MQAAELIALKEAYLPNNYIPPQDPAPPRTPREKFAANITAIRTLKSIEKLYGGRRSPRKRRGAENSCSILRLGRFVRAFETNKDSGTANIPS